MSNSLTYNGIDLGGGNYGFIVTDNDFIKPPQPRINKDTLSSADGDIAQGATFGSKAGAVQGIVVASSYANLITQRNNIAAVLQTGQEGVKAVTFDAWSGKSWQARIDSTTWGEESAVTIELTINFYAPDPWPIATSATNESDSVDGSGETTI